MSLADDLRKAAKCLADYGVTRVCDDYAARLRAHAETIERIEREMRDHAADWRHEWKQAEQWANDLNGDKP